MTREEFEQLQPGDLVRHIGKAEAAVVTARYGARVTAVRTYDITNPAEWDVVVSKIIHVLKRSP